MSVTQALLSPRILGALAAYGALSLALAWVIARVAANAGGGAMGWLWTHLYAPMLRAAAVGAFLLLAYPALFGLAAAPPLGELFTSGEHRLSHFMGLLVLVSLALPLMAAGPLATALVLPLQGIAASALLLAWTGAHDPDLAVSYWPGTGAAAAILAVAVAGYWLAERFLDLLGWAGQRALDTMDLDVAFREGGVLLFQVPAILIYTLATGARLG